jgi:hypothetical protein
VGPEDQGLPIEVRAFRGSRRASVYRAHVVNGEAFERILAVGGEHGLGLLSSLDPFGPHELDKGSAQQLAHEVDSLRRSAHLLEVDRDLIAIGELARWCARTSGRSWLTIALS